MRAGESAAAVDAVVDEVAVVKAVAPMLRYMSWIQSLQLYQNVTKGQSLCHIRGVAAAQTVTTFDENLENEEKRRML